MCSIREPAIYVKTPTWWNLMARLKNASFVVRAEVVWAHVLVLCAMIIRELWQSSTLDIIVTCFRLTAIVSLQSHCLSLSLDSSVCFHWNVSLTGYMWLDGIDKKNKSWGIKAQRDEFGNILIYSLKNIYTLLLFREYLIGGREISFLFNLILHDSS